VIVGQGKKMSDIVMHWEDLKSKMVKAKDKRVGNIVDILDDEFVIQNSRRTKYRVPKSHVDQYNGYEIFLDFSSKDLRKYKTRH
jgi:hypothetical protein